MIKKVLKILTELELFLKKIKILKKIICFFLKKWVYLCHKSSENYENGTFLKKEKRGKF